MNPHDLMPLNAVRRIVLACFLAFALRPVSAQTADSRYAQAVLASKPVAYWRLNDSSAPPVRNLAQGSNAAALDGVVQGKVTLRQPGPRPGAFPDFEAGHTAAAFNGKGEFVRIKDPGARSPLDFATGDSITLEAWVFPHRLPDGQQVYVIGKGRTQNPGAGRDNQNYALRLAGMGGTARINFLFHDARTRTAAGEKPDSLWHRWTAREGFVPGAGWHHIAVTYTFGQGDSLKGYLDGVEIKGTWDMGGKTDLGPVMDDDEVWVGSSMGGNSGSSFNGLIGEVALHRRALAAKEMKGRFNYVPIGPQLAASDLPKDGVRAEIFEGIPAAASWNFTPVEPAIEAWAEPALAFAQLPQKYSDKGVRADRSNPFLLRSAAAVTLPAGEHRLLLRSLQSARLFRDGKLLAATKFIAPGGGGHEEVGAAPGADWPAGLRYLRAGHNDAFITVSGDGKPHVYVLEAIIGGKGLRPETGELSVSVVLDGGLFRLLAPKPTVALTDEGWESFIVGQQQRLAALDAKHRRKAGAAEEKYWAMRHESARRLAAPAPAVPHLSSDWPAQNEIDRFISARLQAAGVKPAPLTGDYSFLRRVALDTTGLLPTPEQIRAFSNDRSTDRRTKVIDRFLASPSWADHWVSYWQDVLAENPAILKPTLNNTGPFRAWLHESFLDNKPMDRFATELVLMEGSLYGGGPAGFSLATQNDVPMADRAQIVSQAFLAMNLTCARCHDAPYHDFKQKDLFNLAAMLKQGPQEVPASSLIPANANIQVGRLVNVSLKPGEQVPPAWPFAKTLHEELTEGVVRKADNTRERLAAFLTDPRNQRFAKVMVNRLWQRYLGRGLVEPVDDWETAKPSHPELLEWLARELATHNYDLKHVARLILNSHTYQRQAGLMAPASDDPKDRLFASPMRRRLTAEQVVDSLFAAVGKTMDCEMLTLDNNCRQAAKDFLNLGYPKRAWEFASLSNDRDRPALSLPKTQEVVDLLGMFGWRESRQNPVSVRDHSPNVLQPAALANGAMENGRIARLTDDCAITELCLREQPLSKLIEDVSLRVLSRPPTAGETRLFAAQLERGYAQRILPVPPQKLRPEFDPSQLLSWANHLNPKATEIKLAVEERARQGDQPTPRLQADWRERMEDVLWAMVNSPEFVFVP